MQVSRGDDPGQDAGSTQAVAVGRQPIVDARGEVRGFELLYRPVQAPAPSAPTLTGEQMTSRVVLGALAIGIEQLVGAKLIFCNADRDVLVGDTPITLPPQQTVIEVLETVAVDDDVVAGCRHLVASGFQIALDDFVWTDGIERLLELASIVKLDFLAHDRETLLALAERCRPFGVVLVAEKVETAADIALGVELGCELFQGYAVERPVVVRGRSLSPSSLAHARLAVTMLSTNLEFEEIEEILRTEPALVVQVLQIASAGAQHGLRRQVRSVREALVLLGGTRIRQWIALSILGNQAAGNPDSIATALLRARTTEVLAQVRQVAAPEVAFTAGLLSTLDLLLGVGLEELATTMGIGDELRQAAFTRTGSLGELVDEVATYHRHVETDGQSDDPTDIDHAAAAAFAWAMPYLSSLQIPPVVP